MGIFPYVQKNLKRVILYIYNNLSSIAPKWQKGKKVMENKVLKKFLVMAIVFVITFSNCGLTLQALATSEGISVFGFSLFGKDRISYKAYFLDENGKEKDEMSADVNSEMTLVLELEPKEVGYLKDGTIRAVTEEGEANFEFKEILNLSAEKEEKEGESLEQTVQLQETLLKTEQVVNAELPEVELGAPENNANTVSDANVVTENNVVSEKVENVTGENTVSNTTATESATNTVQNEVSKEPATTEEQNTVTTESSIPETSMPEDVLVDEEIVYQEEVKENEEAVILPSSAKINSANELAISNIVEPTKIFVKLAYKAGETLKVSDLYKETSLELSGTYINENLEEIEVSGSDNITTEWTYSKDILVSSEITKVSPFEVEGTKGTLVESRVVVNRDCTEENYLPLKETVIELEAPQINGKLPKALDVSAVKLKATTGEEINEITFSSDNWNYDSNSNTITIKVENPNAVLSSGEDIYVITYRYDEYVESEEITVNIKGKVTAEEYSGKENNKIVKEFSDEKNTIVNIGELITYSIGTTEDLVNKAKINANYNSVEAVYETEYTSTVSINILTNDVLREFTLKDIKDFYVDKTNIELEATDVKYKSIKFRYDEIAEILNQGGTIEIKASTGELLYTLNNEVIKSQDNCEIVLNGDVRGVEISVKDIKANGTITIDFVKAIGKCAYEKQVFNNFEKIESRIKAEVKYGTSDEIIELTPLKTEKYFEKSYTRAEISMNKDALSTILDNDNVEIKIELNNHAENSDLYINPEFEVVFPSYVQDVEVKSVNLLYEEGLTVKNIGLFKDSNNVQRMKIQLEGVQRNFSASDITNGTNIIVNTKIMVDDYTPRKEDQLKMYYFNQGVTNYQSQTEWKISTPVPDGIIKTTNGFDVEVFEFQAPSGFITANGIENYDGLGSTIQTIKQGEVTAKAEMGEIPRVVTMTLAALNNTGNKCTDVVMLGRIPNTEATDVITGAKLGTNRDTTMVSLISQDDSNPIGCDIYYSYKADADQVLGDNGNGWTKTPEDISQVKSFLIVPTSEVEPGTAFKYSYNFQIPANLPYEVAMYGSFGAYYNNHSDLAVVYESTKADLVGLTTDIGPKLEANLSVDVGDGTPVGECRFLNYTITVKNTGSETATNVTITNPVPNNSVYYIYDDSDFGLGNNNYVEASPDLIPTFKIDSLAPNEEKSFTFMAKTGRLQSDEEVIIKSKAKVQAENLGIEIESNETKNKVEKRNFDLMINTDTLGTIEVGQYMQYKTLATNISGQDLENVEIECKIPKEFEYTSSYIAAGENSIVDENKISFDKETNTVTATVPKIAKDECVNIKFNLVIAKVSKETVKGFVSFKTKNGEEERTTNVETNIVGAIIEATQKVNSTNVMEGEDIEFTITIKNVGNEDSKGLKIKDEISKYLENVEVYFSDNPNVNVSLTDGNLDTGLLTIVPGTQKVVNIKGKVNNLPENIAELKISNQAKITGEYMDDVVSNIVEVVIKKNPNKEEPEKPEEPKFDNIINQDEESKDQNNNENNNENGSNDNVNNENNANNNTDNNSNQNDSSNVDNNNNPTTEPENKDNQPNYSTPNENTNEETESETKQETKATYNISGIAWLDENKNGLREDREKVMPSIKVYLLTEGQTMIKSTTTDNAGTYTFSNLENGKYIIAFSYDTMLYTTTIYKKSDAGEDRNSDVIEKNLDNLSAVSNTILVENANVEHIDIGLQNREVFDLEISKYLSKATVTTSKGTKEYTYKNADLAKIDIHSKQLEGAKVELEYTILLENKSSLEGYAEQVVDYIGSDIEFDESRNSSWYKGNDGYIYMKNINQTTLKPGEKKEYKITLTKVMTNENTGTVSNKVEIVKALSNSAETEKTDNNTSVQNTIITVSTGRALRNTIIIIFIIAILVGLGYNKRIPINIHFNKTYKSKSKKISLKKFYK